MAKTRKAKQTIIDRTSCDKCLCCDKPAVVGYRGLCVTHYNMFRNAKRACKGRREREQFDMQMVEQSKILSPRRGRRPGAIENPFVNAVKTA